MRVENYSDYDLQRGYYDTLLDEINWRGQRKTVTRYMAYRLCVYDGIIVRGDGGYTIFESVIDYRIYKMQK